MCFNSAAACFASTAVENCTKAKPRVPLSAFRGILTDLTVP